MTNLPARPGLSNQLKTVLLLGLLSAMLVGVGGLLSPRYLWLFGALAVLMNLGAYFFSDRIVLAMHRARDLPQAEAPELHAMVAELSARAGIPRPRVVVIPEAQPNAFATGRDPAHGVVAFTEGILRLLPPRELRGVLAHELAHIRNRDILVSSIAAAVGTLITYLAQSAGLSALSHREGEEGEGGGSLLGGLLLAVTAPVAATLVQLGISRSREYLADETAARLTGDPEALARALERLHQGAEAIPAEPAPATASLFIVNPFAGSGGLLRWFSTHPPMEERVARLREMAARGDGSRRVITARSLRDLLGSW